MAPDRTREGRAHGADGGGVEEAAKLLPELYDELCSLAAAYLRRERSDISLSPTDLVHEAYLRLAGRRRLDWEGRTHLFALAATEMRRILVDHARRKAAAKRGGGARRITLTDVADETGKIGLELLALDEALTRLSARHARRARVAVMRLFAGMPVREIAHEVGLSERTVKEDWRVARAWLIKELFPDGPLR